MRAALVFFQLVLVAAVTAFQPTQTAFQKLSYTNSDNVSHRKRTSSDLSSRKLRQRNTQLQSTNYNALPGSGGGGILLARASNRLHKDVLIVGGGLAGLSVALHLSQIDPTRQITILDKSDMLESPTGSFAAAGMLAPQSERLPKGNYLDLCLASKRMFPEFCQYVERMARESGEEGAKYLVKDDENIEDHGLEPWNIGYVASGGFLAPAFAGDTVATWAPPKDSKGTATWLDATQVRELEPNLHPDVVGGWWFPEDASVDARRLACSLKAACVGAGVQFMCGKNYAASSLDLEEGNCRGLWLANGKYISANSILVANGAWMRNLLPVPLEPHKGQSLSLRMPKDRPPILRRVLFASDSYIVPKADGRIVIGATVEAGSFDGKVTPAGLLHILSYAVDLVPGLADLAIEETWAGLRPTTPDKAPILGETPWKNLYLAGGYWRNGVLLAPKTGELMASLIAGLPLSEEDQTYLDAFSWDRFTSPEGGAEVAANARYAASMYPIHSRKSGAGVAASVGTELGSYSTAVTAGEERRKDRESLWGDEDSFEKAASLGKQDGSVFSLGDKGPSVTHETLESNWDEDGIPFDPTDPNVELPHFLDRNPDLSDEANPTDSDTAKTVPYDGSPDAITVGSATSSSTEKASQDNQNNLGSLYDTIRQNKAQQQVEMEKKDEETKPDPGFRIYHIDKTTGESREVPPYTSPGAFLEKIESESTKNPLKAANQIGDVTEAFDTTKDPAAAATSSDLEAVYEQIRQQKAKTTTELSDRQEEERPDPGFRVYHVDQETQQVREVPPYTAPGDFLASLKKEQESSNLSVDIQKSDPHVVLEEQGKPTKNGHSKSKDYSETSYDGYQDILQSNAADSRAAELEAMRKARRMNRAGDTPITDEDIDLEGP